MLDVITRALSKNAADRFGSTSEMLNALEAIPFSDADRAESQRLLRDLARGEAGPRVPTGAFPALPDMPTLAVPPARKRTQRRLRSLGYAAALAILAGAGWFVTRTTGAPLPRSSAAIPAETLVTSTAVRPPAEPPVPTGKLRILTTPPSAEILVDGRRVGIGSAVDLRLGVGSRRLRVQAAGYQAWDTTIVVQAGVTLSLGRVTLRAPTE